VRRRAAALVVLAGCVRGVAPPAETAVRPAATGAPEVARWPGPKVVARARVVAGGDVLPHTNVKHAAAAFARAGVPHGGWPGLLEPVREIVAGADVAFANLETPVAPDHDRGTRSMVFNAPQELLDGLVDVGFDVVSFANNHVYDQGRAGLVETLDRLDASPLEHVGAGRTCAEARRARLVPAGGLTVAWIGSTRLFNQRLNTSAEAPCAWELDVDAAIAEARAARAAGADAVVLSVHWGREYHVEPDASEVEAAHRLVDGGFDVILGHHPHVLQPIELRDTPDGRVALIAYSLGNLVSNQAYDYRFGVHPHERGRTRDSVLLAFSFVKKDYGPGTAPRTVVELAHVEAIPVWTDSDANGRVTAPAPTIRVVPIGPTLDAAHAALDAEADPAARLALQRRIELLRVRWWSVEQVVGSVWLPPEPR
jgi:poly-gamma-glutamate synthesis protein (capsule biosynthesis protein)